MLGRLIHEHKLDNMPCKHLPYMKVVTDESSLSAANLAPQTEVVLLQCQVTKETADQAASIFAN